MVADDADAAAGVLRSPSPDRYEIEIMTSVSPGRNAAELRRRTGRARP